MKTIYAEIQQNKIQQKKMLAILIDPEKTGLDSIVSLTEKIKTSPATHIFVGGSSFDDNHLDELIIALKRSCDLPILLFPGNANQISPYADGILFLSLLSGRNPEYLIDIQIQAVPKLLNTNLEIIPTGYLLIDGGNETAVARISQTTPINRNSTDTALYTALAGEYSGKKLIYLEAGSGAQNSVPIAMVEEISKHLTTPLIVGGGITSKEQIDEMYRAGADLVVIGTAFENDCNFFNKTT